MAYFSELFFARLSIPTYLIVTSQIFEITNSVCKAKSHRNSIKLRNIYQRLNIPNPVTSLMLAFTIRQISNIKTSRNFKMNANNRKGKKYSYGILVFI